MSRDVLVLLVHPKDGQNRSFTSELLTFYKYVPCFLKQFEESNLHSSLMLTFAPDGPVIPGGPDNPRTPL